MLLVGFGGLAWHVVRLEDEMIEDCFAQKVSCSTITLRAVAMSMCVSIWACVGVYVF